MGTKKTDLQQFLSFVPEYIKKVQCDTYTKTFPFKCAVKSCSNQFLRFEDRCKYPYKFHNFPFNKRLRKIWKIKCGLDKSDHVKGVMVCSDHFNLDDYIRNYKEEFSNPHFKRKLKSNAYPTEKLSAVEKQITINDISDTDYDTDLEPPKTEENFEFNKITTNMLSWSPKGYNKLINEIKIKEGPLDYNEVKQEVDYNIELSLKQVELQKELKSLKSQIKYWNQMTRKVKHKVSINNSKSSTELKILKKVFTTAQINLLSGKRTTWTNHDLARAFTMRHMGSKKCYLYMKNTLNMPLPSLSCVQRWASSYK